MDSKKLIDYARKVATEKPELKSEINGLIELCRDEIDEGGSPEHERSLCYESIRQLAEGGEE